MRRRYPIGAEPTSEGVSFRVWAPDRQRVDVAVEGRADAPLAREPDGYFSGVVRELGAGTLYRYRLDGGDAFPDPASRFQPEGPHGPSEVIDPGAYRWSDQEWQGISPERRVIYELHVGTFTPEGTFAGAIAELPRLAALGVTLVELMPVAEFPGEFGWGYDGVDLWAPSRLYGRPDDLRRFVDAAHATGLGVVLDVVYNHLGPDGNYLAQYAKGYFGQRHTTDWGDAIHFEGSAAVRELCAENAAYWIDELHLDGLRFDATQAIFDRDDLADREHVLAQITRRAREAAGTRPIFLVAENDEQDARLARSYDRNGYGMDALWNEDFHHSAIAAVTGRCEAYYSDTRGTPQELLSAVRWGYLFQGQRYTWWKRRRGRPALDLGARSFVSYIENHDQVSCMADGARLSRLITSGRLRALTALLLLAPATPMLFQGQEYATTRPFLYFADHAGDLGRAVREGRAGFLRSFPSLDRAPLLEHLDDPRATFERCKLDAAEREERAEWIALHTDLLTLRRLDPAFRMQRADRIAGAVLGPEAFVVRYLCEDGDRLLVVNLGAELHLPQVAEPLLASPDGAPWSTLWSSDDPRYGGSGITAPERDSGWTLPAEAAVVLR